MNRKKSRPSEVRTPDATEVIANLAADDHIPRSRLAALTSLDRTTLESFRTVWPGIQLERRRRIVGHLVEMSEDNVELNFDAIFMLCLADSDPVVRATAIEGLWEYEGTHLINLLLNMVENDSSERVQVAAAAALGKFAMLGEQGKLRPGYLERLHETLLRTLHDETRPTPLRCRALESLAPLSLSDVRDAIQAAYEGTDPRLKVSALHAMGKNCDPAWFPLLVSALESDEPEIRFEAATALGELGDDASVPHLISLANDPDAEIQMAVIRALGKIGGKTARDYLQSCLSSRDEAIRDAAQEALHEARILDDPLSPSA